MEAQETQLFNRFLSVCKCGWILLTEQVGIDTCPECGGRPKISQMEGRIGKGACDDACMSARGPVCVCACAGANHAVNHSRGRIEESRAWKEEREVERRKAQEAKRAVEEMRRAFDVKLEYDGERFIAYCDYFKKDIPKAAGFRWDKDRRHWWTGDLDRAEKLRQYAQPSALKAFESLRAKHEASIQASQATDAAIEIPVPAGMSYLPYQKAGVAYAMARNSTLIGDEMGLGKTIQAIGFINQHPDIERVLIACPASLKLNWRRELKKWLVGAYSIGIAQGSSFPGDCDIVIINYDIISKHKDRIDETAWCLFVADEAHYLKNSRSQRSQATLSIAAERRIFLTGTPIANRPSELWPLIHALDPGTWGNWYQFMTRYCGAVRTSHGWDVSGATNLEELHEKLRASVMIRRLKKDVLKELPPKTRQVIELPCEKGDKAILEEQKRIYQEKDRELQKLRQRVAILAKAKKKDPERCEAEYREAVKALRESQGVAFSEMARLRHEVALLKVPRVVEFLREVFESDPERKVVLFAHHKDAIAEFMKAFPGAVAVIGDMNMEARQASVDRFQNDPKCRLFVGSITAAGVGLTLTASSHVVFAELDWVPGNMSQAEDRCHRIGQTNSVFVQHIVLEESLDAYMAKTLIHKQEVIEKALDGEKEEAEFLEETTDERVDSNPKQAPHPSEYGAAPELAF